MRSFMQRYSAKSSRSPNPYTRLIATGGDHRIIGVEYLFAGLKGQMNINAVGPFMHQPPQGYRPWE